MSADSGALPLRTVDPADAEAVAAWSRVPQVAFMRPAPEDAGRAALESVERMAGHRLSGVVDAGRWVATYRSFDSELTLPGTGPVSVNAVSTVTVLPTHRRRGLLRRLIGEDLRRARESGHALAVLIAAEAPIYGRFGFGAATASAGLVLDAGAVRFRADAPGGSGRLELVEPALAWRELSAVHDAARRARPGGLLREDVWWRQWTRPGARGALGPQAHVVLHRDGDGRADGYAAYEVSEEWAGRVSRCSARVLDLQALSPGAYRDLWGFVTSLDWVRTVHAADRPVDEVLPLLLEDPRAVQRGAVDDFLWVRPLDAAGALAARRYLGCGSLVLRVLDEDGPAAATVRLHVDAQRCGQDGWTCAEVTATSQEPDVVLGAAELGALLLGGVSAVALAAAGRVAGSPAAVQQLQSLLATPRAPWCPTWF
ncbi:GNAT family N-acetyltransferase [Kineococcus sp. TRM81007]|uniref:GNAT family N-acetyltransferase n=1 Tax=Kineococcus sp. TRM81007 TaxID=2925831 RepID=UPI001F5A75E9|nr:GNAT family N-acetyltransferase [Kineococcus sp. TRM81007]MCI2239074.1 GNAT family N-acetyltransferase [Kineococcus sp. TRM81007]